MRDSAAEVVLALFFFISMTVALAWAALKVIRIAKRSVNMHKNPAYILYSDPSALNKWGFLYVQFRATAYYFILPVLAYSLLKAIFIAFAQSAGTVQAIALVLIEGLFLIAACVLRPWMDKKINAFNISIAVINFLNVIFLLIFTSIFNQPVSLRIVPVSCDQVDVLPGYRYWSNGSYLLHYERHLCSSPPNTSFDRLDLRHCVQESRHALSADAGRSWLLHQIPIPVDH